MSGVFRRNRTETRLQFYVNALDLQVEITKFVMREKVMPKKWRYSQGYKLLDKVDYLMDCIVIANSIYPTTLKSLFFRKFFQVLSIAFCYSIQNKLILIEKCVDTVKPEHLDEMIDLIGHEIELLKSWKKSTKLIKE